MGNNDLEKMISVVIPMYNNRATIKKTLDSIKNQTAINRIFEVLVIDDGSTDDSSQIVEKYILEQPHIPITLINKQNNGVSSARNVGLRISQAGYIALLDADDEWLSDKTEKQMDILDDNPSIDFIGSNYNDKELKILFRKIKKLYKANVVDLCFKFFPVTPSAIFKKQIIADIGYFNENQKHAEDGNYFMKICTHYNYYHLPESLVICGQGKPEFGYSGLSANLKGMYEGNLYNLKELNEKKIISRRLYIILRLFYYFKYLRRILLTKYRNLLKVRG